MKAITLDLSLKTHPWVYFFLFLTANAILSYAPLPSGVLLAIFLFGVFLPFYIAIRTDETVPSGQMPWYEKEYLKPIPSWALVLVLALALFLRFYRLQTLAGWPNLDEGWIGTLALELSRNWRWKFFYTFGQTPPLTVWLAALGFKAGLNPFLSLWLPAAMVSFVTVLMGYWSARLFLPRGSAFLFACLLSIGYWPLLIGRICHQGMTIPLFCFLSLVCLGLYLKSGTNGSRKVWAVALGFSIGLGFLSFTPWPVAALVLILVFWRVNLRGKNSKRIYPWFLGALILASSPFWISALREGYGQHLISVSSWGGSGTGTSPLSAFWRYFSCLLWGTYDNGTAYTSSYGGFLNPLMGSFFLIGLLGLIAERKRPFVRWLLGGFLVLLLPGLLSLNVEAFRIVQIMPLLFFITLAGMLSLLSRIASRLHVPLLILVLLASAAMDLTNLVLPLAEYQKHPENFGRPAKSIERFRAYHVLNTMWLEAGPGMILTDLDPESYNEPTLSVMTTPFNSARTPGLDPDISHWAAIFVNVHYQPYLKERFPDARWWEVGHDLGLPDGGHLLGVIPVTDSNRSILKNWFQFHQVLQRTDQERFLQNWVSIPPLLQILQEAEPLAEGDRFLESVYWDKTASFEYEKLDFSSHLLAYRNAIQRGYPTADLCFKLGSLLLTVGRTEEAKWALTLATQAPLDLTPSKELLGQLLGAKTPGPLTPNAVGK